MWIVWFPFQYIIEVLWIYAEPQFLLHLVAWRVWITQVNDYIIFTKEFTTSVCSATGSKMSYVSKDFTSLWNADCRCIGTF